MGYFPLSISLSVRSSRLKLEKQASHAGTATAILIRDAAHDDGVTHIAATLSSQPP